MFTQYRTLSPHLKKVSRLAIGSLTVGPLQADLCPERAGEILAYAFDRGVNFLDTAQYYRNYPHIRAGLQKAKHGDDVVISSKAYVWDRPGTLAAVDEARRALDRDYIDIFMPQAPTRDHLGAALKGRREKFLIQGHLCTVYEDEQYTRTRDIEKTKRSFEDLLHRLQTDYIDIGMIHYVDSEEDFQTVFGGEIIEYAKELKEKGIVRYLGMSSHNPHIAKKSSRDRAD